MLFAKAFLMNAKSISGLMYAVQLIATARDGLYDDATKEEDTPIGIIRRVLLSHTVLMAFVIVIVSYDSDVALRFVNFYELNYDCPLFEWQPCV